MGIKIGTQEGLVMRNLSQRDPKVTGGRNLALNLVRALRWLKTSEAIAPSITPNMVGVILMKLMKMEASLQIMKMSTKVKDLQDALKKLRVEKQSQSGLTVASPFTKKVRDSPLPITYRDLRFNGTTDPVEYLS